MFDGIVGGILDFIGGERRNDAAEEAAQKQMEFQEYMSSSAYQRAVKDLEKAGLNPMLALMKGGASSPHGAMANVENTMGSAVNTAMSSSVQSETVRNLREQNELLKSQQKKTEAESRNIDMDTMVKNVMVPQIEQQTGASVQSVRESEQRTQLMLRQTETEVNRAQLTYEETRLVEERVRNAVREGRRIETDTDLKAAEAVLKKLEEFRARNRAVFEVEQAGYAQKVRPFLEDAQRFFGSGAAAARMFRDFGRRR